jgi:transcriptional/translational regulatory protein YebC/TACO1
VIACNHHHRRRRHRRLYTVIWDAKQLIELSSSTPNASVTAKVAAQKGPTPPASASLDESDFGRFVRFVDAIEEIDDVQRVFHNVR